MTIWHTIASMLARPHAVTPRRLPGRLPALRSRRAVGFVACSIACALLAQPAGAFDYFEHRYIGDMAFQNALDSHKGTAIYADINRVAANTLRFGATRAAPESGEDIFLNELPLQFGDLTALAGDLSEDVPDLKRIVQGFNSGAAGWSDGAHTTIIETRRQWFNVCRWLYRSRNGAQTPESTLSNCLALLPHEDDARLFSTPQPNYVAASQGYHANRGELAAWEVVPNYVSLASENKNHFARHSWITYAKYHQKALLLADCYREGKTCGMSDRDQLLAEVLYFEGFAQHFLHDSFASGHLGVEYGDCVINYISFMCSPTKQRLQQTHDALDELGIAVKLVAPTAYVWPSREDAANLQRGWTAFGDDHLFIKESDFHRAVVIHTATRSMEEVIDRLVNAPQSSAGTACLMCTSDIFPVPRDEKSLKYPSASVIYNNKDLTSKDYPDGDLVAFEFHDSFNHELRSRDPRVPGIPVEGWKLGAGYVEQLLGSPSSGNVFGKARAETGVMLKLDYMRNTGPWRPNVYGLELWDLPDLRTSYDATVGYSWPQEVAPFSLAIKLRVGWRIEQNFTPTNPTPQRKNGLEIGVPVEFTYALYPPVSIFAQFTYASVIFHKSGHVTEGTNRGTFAGGLKFDLSGV